MWEINIESIIFYLLLLDALGANFLAWGNAQTWWRRHLPVVARYLPLSKGWTSYYLVVVIVMGILLFRLDALVVPLL